MSAEEIMKEYENIEAEFEERERRLEELKRLDKKGGLKYEHGFLFNL